MRTCEGCRRVLELEQFPLSNRRADGQQYPGWLCADCRSEIGRGLRTRSPEERLDSKRRRNLEHMRRKRKEVKQ